VSIKPLVSVLISFFNAEKFLREAIDSVFAQTYENWELLLVDDGSTDGSTGIARQYTEAYPGKVFYLEHPYHQNRGANAARNLGINRARGKYVALLDSDDLWLPHKLWQQVHILESHPEASMVYGLSRYWSSWTGKSEDAEDDFIPELGIPGEALYEPPALLTLVYPLGSANPPCVANFMFRREMAERIGGFDESFKGKYQMFDEQTFLMKVYLKETVFVSEECWDLYRQHPDSYMAMVMKAGRYYRTRLFFLDWFANYLSDQQVKDRTIWKLLWEEQRIAWVRVHLRERQWQRAVLAMLVLLWHHPGRFVRRLQRLIAGAQLPDSGSAIPAQKGSSGEQ
jgi:glycosyltransferase involved in cell wall biosynthesis